MPFLVGSVLLANQTFSPVADFDPESVLSAIEDSSSVRAAAEALGLLEVLSEDQALYMGDFLDSIPGSLDAAMLAALRDAFSRGVRVQISWQPGYDFELRAWEASEGSAGLCNLHVVSPHPYEGPASET